MSLQNYYALMEFESQEQAYWALNQLSGKTFFRLQLKIKFSRYADLNFDVFQARTNKRFLFFRNHPAHFICSREFPRYPNIASNVLRIAKVPAHLDLQDLGLLLSLTHKPLKLVEDVVSTEGERVCLAMFFSTTEAMEVLSDLASTELDGQSL